MRGGNGMEKKRSPVSPREDKTWGSTISKAGRPTESERIKGPVRAYLRLDNIQLSAKSPGAMRSIPLCLLSENPDFVRCLRAKCILHRPSRLKTCATFAVTRASARRFAGKPDSAESCPRTGFMADDMGSCGNSCKKLAIAIAQASMGECGRGCVPSTRRRANGNV